MSEPIVKDDAKGVGPFLLAYTEMRRTGLGHIINKTTGYNQ